MSLKNSFFLDVWNHIIKVNDNKVFIVPVGNVYA